MSLGLYYSFFPSQQKPKKRYFENIRHPGKYMALRRYKKAKQQVYYGSRNMFTLWMKRFAKKLKNRGRRWNDGYGKENSYN